MKTTEEQEFINKIAERLKDLLKESNTSVTQMAEDIQVSRVSIHNILNAKGNPKIRLLYKCIAYLGYENNPEQFFIDLRD